MKKILSFTALMAATLAFTACNSEEDDLFNRSAAERLMDSQKAYTERLAATNAGWAMEFYPTNGTSAPQGKGYLMLADFNTDGSVRMAMQNEMSGNQYIEDTSLWEVIADQGPVLSFNSRNQCLHYFSDPGIYDTGLGYEGDYEFEVLNLEENATYAMLKGKKRGTYIRLTRLDDGTDFEQYFTDVLQFQNTVFSSSAPNDCLLHIGDSTYVVTNASSGIIDIYPYGGDPISQTTSHPFLMTKHDGKYYLRFREEIEVGEMKVQELAYDPSQDIFSGVDNEQYYIQGPDAATFYNEQLEDSKTWTLAYTAEMSAQLKTYLDAVNTELKAVNRNFTLNSFTFGYDAKSEQYQWTLTYLSSGRPANQVYYFDYTPNVEESLCAFNFKEASNTAAQNVMSRCPTLSTLWDVFSQEWLITAAPTQFNLSKVKLTSKSDSELWFVLNIK